MSVTALNDIVWLTAISGDVCVGRRSQNVPNDDLKILFYAHTDDWNASSMWKSPTLGLLLREIKGSDHVRDGMVSNHAMWLKDTSVYVVVIPDAPGIFFFSSQNVKIEVCFAAATDS